MAQQCLDRDIDFSPASRLVTVSVGGRTSASTGKALSIVEGSYPPVLYKSVDVVDAAVPQPSDHHTTCPFKGVASYYDLQLGDSTTANAVWFYADPCPKVKDVLGHVEFSGEGVALTS